jgi:hypothetical protein
MLLQVDHAELRTGSEKERSLQPVIALVPRFMSAHNDEPAETTKAGHEVIGLVRGNSRLSHLVLRLRESGLSWPQVKVAIEAEINRRANGQAPSPLI